MPLPTYKSGLPWYKDAANAAFRAIGKVIFGPMWVVEAYRPESERWEVVGGTWGTRGAAAQEAARLGSVGDGLEFRARRQTEADKMEVARRPLPATQPDPRLIAQKAAERAAFNRQSEERPDPGVVNRRSRG